MAAQEDRSSWAPSRRTIVGESRALDGVVPPAARCGFRPLQHPVNLGQVDVAEQWGDQPTILTGHKRYAHVTALRGDAVPAQALSMPRVISEASLRRALQRLDEASSAVWMRPSLMNSVREALDRPWVLDIDASIKPLYGRQEGTELGRPR